MITSMCPYPFVDQVAEITVLRNRMQQIERENLRLENDTWRLWWSSWITKLAIKMGKTYETKWELDDLFELIGPFLFGYCQLWHNLKDSGSRAIG